jgi:membrane protein YdbS with pleckstrin-like domain
MQHNNEKTLAELEKKLEHRHKIFQLIGLAVVVLWAILITVSVFMGNKGNNAFFWAAIAIIVLYCIAFFVWSSMVEKKVRIARGYYIESGVKYFVDSRGKVTHKVIGKVVFDE